MRLFDLFYLKSDFVKNRLKKAIMRLQSNKKNNAHFKNETEKIKVTFTSIKNLKIKTFELL